MSASVTVSFSISSVIQIDGANSNTAAIQLSCSPAVERLREYIEIHAGKITTCVAPIFAAHAQGKQGTDKDSLNFLSEICLLGLMQNQGEKKQNLLAAYCITKGMQDIPLVKELLNQFGSNSASTGLSNAIKALCQQLEINPAFYPGLKLIVDDLKLVQDSMSEGKKIPVEISKNW